MKRITYLFVFAILINGCATVPYGDMVFKYEMSVIPTTLKIEKTVGLNTMLDNLPNKDKKYTKHIPNVMDKITVKLLEDFEKCKVFKDIHLGVKSDDDIIINGTVNRFFWEYKQNSKTWIPFAGPFISPFWITNGIANITLEIKDNKTGAVIGIFQESSELKGNYAGFETANIDGNNAQSELADAFKNVVNNLRQDILAKFNYPVTVSNVDEIRKYKELLDTGAITKTEYELKKKQLLGL